MCRDIVDSLIFVGKLSGRSLVVLFGIEGEAPKR